MSTHASTQILGAIVGATAGSSRQGSTEFRRVEFYEPLPLQMVANEGFDAWTVWAQHLRDGKLPEALGQTRGDELALRSIEASFGDINIKAGIYPPFSGNFRHPLSGSAEVWVRALFWGIACTPHEAANYAYWDVECDQGSENAVIAATLAAALSTQGPVDWLRRMIGLVERVTSAKQVLRLVAALTTEGYDPQEIHRRLPAANESRDPNDVILNLGYLATSILAGRGDFNKTMTVAMGCGGSSSSTCAYVGALLGGWIGAVPADWSAPLGETFVSANVRKKGLEVSSIEDFVQLCFGDLPTPQMPKVIEAVGAATPLPVEDPSTGYVAELIPAPEVAEPAPVDVVEPVVIPAVNSGSCVYVLDDMMVTVTYDDLPVAHPERTIRCIVTVESVGDELTVNPIVHTPLDWTLAHRLVSCRISKGAKQTFPLVVQPGEMEGPALVQFGDRFIPIVAVRPQAWYLTGPFPNFDGFGFEKPLRCEDNLRESETFNGRGDLGTRWKRRTFAGVTFDLEPYFMEGAGILCLHGRIVLPAAGTYRIVVSGSPGALVKVDNKTLIKYMDTHQPIRRPMKPYVADFQTHGICEITIRVARHLEPASPLTIYFLDDQGKVVMPIRTLPMAP